MFLVSQVKFHAVVDQRKFSSTTEKYELIINVKQLPRLDKFYNNFWHLKTQILHNLHDNYKS